MTWDTATGTHRRGRSIGSFRKDKEDLALFEDLSMREDLDSPLEMETAVLSGYRVTSRRGIGHDLLNADIDKNDFDWLMTPPDTPLSPELGPSTVLLNRTLSAIKTSRNPGPSRAEAVAISNSRRNSSPTRSSKSPQRSRSSASKSPRPIAGASSMTSGSGISSYNRRSSPHNSRPSTPTVSSYDPAFKSSTPRSSASSSHRQSTGTLNRPSTPPARSTSTSRGGSLATSRNAATSSATPKVASSSYSSSTRSSATSSSNTPAAASTGRRSSPAANRLTATASRASPSTPRGSKQSATRGTSPTTSASINTSRGSSPARSNVVSRGSSPGRGSKSPARGPSPHVTRIPSPPGRKASPPKGPSKPILAYDFLSETPANLRTTSASRTFGGPGSLSRSTDGLPGAQQLRRHSTSPSDFQNYMSKSQDRGAMHLNRSQDRGTNYLSKSQDRGPMSLTKSQDRGGQNFDRSGASSFSSQPTPSRRASLDSHHGHGQSRKVTVPEYDMNGRRLSTGSRDMQHTGGRASLARKTTLQQDPAFGNSVLRRSTDSTASRSVGFNNTQQSSLNSSGGFKPFMTNSSIPSFYNAIPSMSLHRKLHQMDGEPHTPSSPSGSEISSGIAPGSLKSTSWEAGAQSRRDSTPPHGSSGELKSPVKRQQMGFELKREDVRVAQRGMETALRMQQASQTDSVHAKSSEEGVKQPVASGYPSGLTASIAGGQGHVKIYQGLGDMEDVGGSWCCGMEDSCRNLCKKHDCGIYKKFHNALVLDSSPDIGDRRDIKSSSTAADSEIQSKPEDPEEGGGEWESEKERSPGPSNPQSFSSNRPHIEVGSASDTDVTRSPTPSPTPGSHSRAGVRKSREFAKGEKMMSDSESSPHYQDGSSTMSGADLGLVSGDAARERQRSPLGWEKEEKLRPSISYAADHEVGRRQNSREKTVRRHSPLKPHDSLMSSQSFSRSGSVTPEETSPLDGRAPASALRGHQSRQRKSAESSRHRQLKPPDFFEVTKREGDGGMITAVSRVQNFNSPAADGGSNQRPWVTMKSNSGGNSKNLDHHVPLSDGESDEDTIDGAPRASSLIRGLRNKDPNFGAGSEWDRELDDANEKKFNDLLQDEDPDDEYLQTHGLDLSGAEESFVDIVEDTNERRPAGFKKNGTVQEESKKLKSPRAAERPARFSRAGGYGEAGYGGALYKKNDTVSRGSLNKSVISRISSTSATSIDLTRSCDTTCSAHSQYDNALWDDPLYSANPKPWEPKPWEPKPGGMAAPNVIGVRVLPVEVGSVEPLEAELPSARHPANGGATQSGGKIIHEKLAQFMRSASQNARKRRLGLGLGDSAEELSSQESCFDYFVDFLESQASLDLEGLEASDITDVLVSAHDEARKTSEGAPGGVGNLMHCLDSRLSSNNSLVSDKSVESRITDVSMSSSESSWESGKSRSVQTLGNTGQVMEQIVESVNSLASDSPKYLSSFKFGQKKTAAGALENITTTEVGLESASADSTPSPSRLMYSKQVSKAKSEPSPPQQKFSKHLNKTRSWKTMSPVPQPAPAPQRRQPKHERTSAEEKRAVVAHALPTPGSLTPESMSRGVSMSRGSGRVSELGASASDLNNHSGKALATAEVHDEKSAVEQEQIPTARVVSLESLSQKRQQQQKGSSASLVADDEQVSKETPQEMLMSPPTASIPIAAKAIDNPEDDDARDDMSARHVNKGCGCTIL